MYTKFAVCNSWLNEHMFLVVLTGLFVGFSWAPGPSDLFSILVIVLFAYMTFVTALGTSLKDFIRVFKKPLIPLWSLLLIHFAAPAIAWLIGIIFYPDDFSIRIGLLILASIPVGVTSIMWTAIVKGNVPLALIVVTIDTFIAPILLPVFLQLIAGKTMQIDFWKMFFQLLMMVSLPSFAGMILHDAVRGKTVEFARSVGGLTAKISLFGVILINAAQVGPSIHWNVTMGKMLFVVLLMAVCGYSLGFLGGRIFRDLENETTKAIIYTVGMRNISFGSVLAVVYFSPAIAVPVTLGMLFQQPLAATIAYFLSRREKAAAKKKSMIITFFRSRGKS
ncbi:MAG: bile acid:sodium symporter family protein [Desulfitobacteriaceae bacterium]|nr:bile acid:sodium symporter family protein [Desulfitobacteriaceae bacterium]MDD4345801.1 bile acid:sodium symporter family protein [Desulfitobacteriaceae bacterium]MDD4402263.1 bile acid:sodium symporter family protein [Desulfitobacteriaceae bacterium]